MMNKKIYRILTSIIAVLAFGAIMVGCGAELSGELAANEGAALFTEEGVTPVNQFMTAIQQTEGKESPDSGSPTVATIEAGTMVYVIGEATEDWYLIVHSGERQYAEKTMLQLPVPDEELIREMNALGEENIMVNEAVERARAAVRQARVWGIVIVLLIGGILAVGITSTIKNSKAEKAAKEADQAGLEWLDLEESEEVAAKAGSPGEAGKGEADMTAKAAPKTGVGSESRAKEAETEKGNKKA